MIIPREGETPPPDEPPDGYKKNRTKNFYKEKNRNASYLVMIEADEKTEKNIGKCSHLKIAKEICELKLEDVLKIEQKGKNKVSIIFSNYNTANNLVNNQTLIEKGYNVYIPYSQVSCKGIIRNIDLELDETLLKSIIKSHVNILEIKRLNRKIVKATDNNKEVEYTPTGSILITFEGVILPRYVSIYSLEFPVITYIPPTTQCLACLMFGHISKQCRGKPKCNKCGWVLDETKEDSNLHECSGKCFFCKSSSHDATSKKCPEYIRQTQIKKTMIFENISYFDANKLCKKTYSGLEGSDFRSEPSDFPQLINKTQNKNNNINVSQRREITEPNIRHKRTYGEVTSEAPRKKMLTNNRVGYNQKEIDETLYFPNSRPEKTIGNKTPIFHKPNYSVSGSSKVDDTTNYNLPSSAQQYIIQENIKKIIDSIIQIPDINKIQIKDFINTYFNHQDYMDLDSSDDV